MRITIEVNVAAPIEELHGGQRPPLPGKLTPLHPDHFHHQGSYSASRIKMPRPAAASSNQGSAAGCRAHSDDPPAPLARQSERV